MRACDPRTTCALVTMTPSPDQIMPEPPPRLRVRIRTVERRSCSAISPNPVMDMSFASVRAFTNYDRGLLDRSTANEFRGECLAYGGAVKLGLHILELSDRMPRERDENIADRDAGLARRAVRLDFKDNRGCLLV